MTSPNQQVPPKSAQTGTSNSSGLAAFAAKTGDQWKGEATSGFESSYGGGPFGFLGKLISYLFGGFTGGVGDFISSLFGGLSGTSGGGFLDLLGSLVGTKNKANDAFTASTNNTVAITDLTTIVNAQRTTQAYVGNLTDMPTAPRALLTPYISGTNFNGITHNHTYNPSAGGSTANTGNKVADGTITLTRTIPSFSPQVNKVTSSAGTAYFTPIIVDRSGLIDKFRFITGADGSLFPVDAYYVGLYILNTSGTPTLLKFWDPGDVSGSMGSSLNEVAITTALSSSAGTVAPGQVLCAAHLQSAPGLAQPSRSVAWVPQSGVGRTTDVLLQGAYYSLANQSGLPSSVALSALTARNDGIPWYAVSVNS